MKILSDDAYADMVSTWAWVRCQLEDQTKQIAHLTEQIIELKRDGFARATPSLAAPYEHAKMDDRIMAAIRAMAPEGSRLEGELMQFANSALLADGEVEDVADMILAGSTLGDD